MRRRNADDQMTPMVGLGLVRRGPDEGDGSAGSAYTKPARAGGAERAATVAAAGRIVPFGRPKERRAMHPSQPRPTPISRHPRYEERSAMAYQMLSYMTLEARRRDMLAEAERARTIAEASAATRVGRRTVATAVATMRRHVGTAMVCAGERLQGAQGAEAVPSADARSTVGALRIAR